MLEVKQKVLSYVRSHGPVIPVHVSRGLNISIVLAGALLSELFANKELFISTAKIGTSPVYYVKGQEVKLQNLRQHLGETERKAFDLLKEGNVLKDNACTPWQRVAYRELKDFAKQFQHENETYWRWYLTNEEEARKKFHVPEKIIVPELKIEQPVAVVIDVTEKKTIEEIPLEKPKKRRKEKSKEKQETLNPLELPLKLKKFFEDHGIQQKEQPTFQGGKDVEVLTTVSASFGTAHYLTIFLDKKKLNEGDISMVYARGHKKRAPVLLLSTGELTKKAEKYLEDYKGNIIYRKDFLSI